MIQRILSHRIVIFIFVSILLFGSWYYVLGRNDDNTPDKADLVQIDQGIKVG